MTIHPDARSHGNFLHRVFEKSCKSSLVSHLIIAQRKAIQEASQEAEFEALYTENSEALFAQRSFAGHRACDRGMF